MGFRYPSLLGSLGVSFHMQQMLWYPNCINIFQISPKLAIGYDMAFPSTVITSDVCGGWVMLVSMNMMLVSDMSVMCGESFSSIHVP